MTSRRSEVRDPAEVVRDYLARGVTGCLEVVDHRGKWRLYVMQGEILAAHGPQDGEAVVRRMLNGDAISPKQADQLQEDIERGESFEGLLLGRVPEDLFLDLLVQRFRQNVLDFLSCPGRPRFEPLEAVFVDNIQTGHDSHELLDSLDAVRRRTAELRANADSLIVRASTGVPAHQMHARLLDIAEPERLLSSLLGLSPYEDGATLQAVADMRDQGVVELVELGDDATQVSGVDEDQVDEIGFDDLQVEEDDAAGLSDDDQLELDSQPQLEPELLVDMADEPALVPEIEGPRPARRREPDHLSALEAMLEPEPRLDGDSSSTLLPGASIDDDDDDTQQVPPQVQPEPVDDLVDLASDLIQPISQSFLDDAVGDALAAADSSDAATTVAPRKAAAGASAGTSSDAPSASAAGAEEDQEEDDPNVELAIRRAQEIEARRNAARQQLERDENGVTARPPPGFDWEVPVPDEELAFFEDQDDVRGGGKGQFTTEQQNLDVVDLSAEGMAAFERAMNVPVDSQAGLNEPLHMPEATPEELNDAVSLSFYGPRLDDDDVRRKIDVVNDVLAEVVAAIDTSKGRGSGRVSLQLLVDGPPTRFAALFRGVQVDEDGHMNTDRLVKNLRKRPQGEHRRLLNDGMLDLIQRCLSASLEELDDESVDSMLENIAGYQQRLGI